MPFPFRTTFGSVLVPCFALVACSGATGDGSHPASNGADASILDASSANLPDANSANLPDANSANLPDANSANLPDASSANLPDASSATGATTYAHCTGYPGDGSASLALAPSPTGLTATFTLADAGPVKLDFAVTSDAAATLSPTPQRLGRLGADSCETHMATFVAATLTATAGSLAYDSNTAFLSFTTLEVADAGAMQTCLNLDGTTTAITCTSDGGLTGAGDAAAAGTGFSAGTYNCQSTVDDHYVHPEQDGGIGDVIHPSAGALTLTVSGSSIVANYSADPFVWGSFQFAATTATTATLAAGGAPIFALCSPSGVSTTVAPTTGQVTTDGTGLSLSLSGPVSTSDGGSPPPCSGDQFAVILTCSRQ